MALDPPQTGCCAHAPCLNPLSCPPEGPGQRPQAQARARPAHTADPVLGPGSVTGSRSPMPVSERDSEIRALLPDQKPLGVRGQVTGRRSKLQQ